MLLRGIPIASPSFPYPSTNTSSGYELGNYFYTVKLIVTNLEKLSTDDEFTRAERKRCEECRKKSINQCREHVAVGVQQYRAHRLVEDWGTFKDLHVPREDYFKLEFDDYYPNFVQVKLPIIADNLTRVPAALYVSTFCAILVRTWNKKRKMWSLSAKTGNSINCRMLAQQMHEMIYIPPKRTTLKHWKDIFSSPIVVFNLSPDGRSVSGILIVPHTPLTSHWWLTWKHNFSLVIHFPASPWKWPKWFDNIRVLRNTIDESWRPSSSVSSSAS